MIWAVGAGLCCVALGLNSGAVARRRLHRLEDGIEALQRMRLALEERQPLCGVFASAGEGPMGQRLRDVAHALQSHPLVTPDQIWQGETGLPADEKAWWAALLMRLNEGSLESRCQAVEQAEKQLNRTLEKERQKEERTQPLRRSLSGLGGLAVLLLLW